MKIFLVPGLGADERLFQNFDIPYHCDVINLPVPEISDDLTTYSYRVSQLIPKDNPFILIGVSLGGIICQNMGAHLKECKAMIIISSIKSLEELPPWFRFAGKLNLHRFIRPWLIKRALILIRIFIGSGSKEGFLVFKKMLMESPNSLISWSIPHVANWKGTDPGVPLVHIHGSNDHLFPLKNIRNAIPVKGGKHFMVFNMADVVNRVVREQLELLKHLIS